MNFEIACHGHAAPSGVQRGLAATEKNPSSRPLTLTRIKSIAAVLMDVASETGRTPSQLAINWVRQRPFHMIPILGARSEKLLKDNLGSLEFELTNEQIERLNEASPIDLGFPHSFLNMPHVRGLIHGKTFDQTPR